MAFMKKVTLLLVVLFCTILPMNGQVKVLSETDALDVLTSYYENTDNMNIYIASVERLSNGYVNDDDGTYWSLFVDEFPMLGWEHPCSQFFVPKNYDIRIGGKQIESVQLRMPPTDITYDMLHTYQPEGININDRPILKKNTGVKRLPSPVYVDSTHIYAVIISGGGSIMANHTRYWNDCSFIYQTLVNTYGIPKSNITALISDGDDPAKDQQLGYEYFNSSTDLDGDGIADYHYAATKSNVVSVFNNLANQLTADDHLFVYVIDHGGWIDGTKTAYLWLWNNEKLYDTELAKIIDNIPAGYMSFLLGQCYSGGFIDNLEGQNRVVTTACTYYQSSHAHKSKPYDEFVYNWTSAINGYDIEGNKIEADNGNKGYVSLEDAYGYAFLHNTWTTGTVDLVENPCYSSTPVILGRKLSFGRTLPKIDLYIKVDSYDDGYRPLTFSSVNWNSPDVWVRRVSDGYDFDSMETIDQDTAPQDSAYLYVKVHNRGTDSYAGNGNYLHLFLTNRDIFDTTYLPPSMQNRFFTHHYILPLDMPIPSGAAKTIENRFKVPSNLFNAVYDYDVSIIAAISDSSNFNLSQVTSDYLMNSNDIGLQKMSVIVKKPEVQPNDSLIGPMPDTLIYCGNGAVAKLQSVEIGSNSMRVVLDQPAQANTSVVAKALTPAVKVESIDIPEGQDFGELMIARKPESLYSVDLVVNGEIVDSKTILSR